MWHVLFTLLGVWLKILLVSVKLTCLGNYFTEKNAKRQLTWFTVLLRMHHFCCFFTFRAERCKSYWLYWKMLQTKVAQNYISCKKLIGSRSLYSPWSGAGGAKHLPCTGIKKYTLLEAEGFQNYRLYWKILQTKIV